MNQPRFRAAVTPLRRRFPDAAAMLPMVDEVVALERPEEPMHCLRPATIEALRRVSTPQLQWRILGAASARPPSGWPGPCEA